MNARRELRSLRWILERVEKLSPASREWLVARITADLKAAQ